MSSGRSGNNTWSIEQGDYKRIVEAGRSYKNFKRNSRLSKKIYVCAYIFILIVVIFLAGHVVSH